MNALRLKFAKTYSDVSSTIALDFCSKLSGREGGGELGRRKEGQLLCLARFYQKYLCILYKIKNNIEWWLKNYFKRGVEIYIYDS